jgi:hypothetical protein
MSPALPASVVAALPCSDSIGCRRIVRLCYVMLWRLVPHGSADYAYNEAASACGDERARQGSAGLSCRRRAAIDLLNPGGQTINGERQLALAA